jgi:DNA-binding MarR family transcriptional regulator/GNAT superfamily N-acetyltransferase
LLYISKDGKREVNVEKTLAQRVDAVRRFNRFYTKQIGVLEEHLLKSPFSLAEARVVYELAQHEWTTATALITELGLDAGYLSRILLGLQKRRLLERKPSETDGRQSLLRLTASGKEAFSSINRDAARDVVAMLKDLPEESQSLAVAAMQTIERLLGSRREAHVPYVLRPPRPGDLGWVVQRHGELYAKEYGWDDQFEAMVAEIVATFVRAFDPKRERCWIAEKDGQNVGSVLLVRRSQTVAQLRLLLVEPKARGLGIGSRFVAECTRFALQARYRKITLWTNTVLSDARHIYEKAGYVLVGEKPHHSFGQDLIAQTWELDLKNQTGRVAEVTIRETHDDSVSLS